MTPLEGRRFRLDLNVLRFGCHGFSSRSARFILLRLYHQLDAELFPRQRQRAFHELSDILSPSSSVKSCGWTIHTIPKHLLEPFLCKVNAGRGLLKFVWRLQRAIRHIQPSFCFG